MAQGLWVKTAVSSAFNQATMFFVKTATNSWSQITDAWVKTSTSVWSKFYTSKYAPDTNIELLQTTATDGYTLILQGKQKHWTPNPVSLRYYFKYIDSNSGTYYIGSGGSGGEVASNASTGSSITYPSSSTYITIDTKGSNYSIGGTATYYFEVRAYDDLGTAYPSLSQEVVQISTPTAPNVTVTAYDTNSITISISSTSYNNWYLTNRYVVYTYDSVGGLIESGGGRGGYGIESSYGSTKSITLTGLTKGRTYGIYVAPFTGSAGSTTANATGYAGSVRYVSQPTVNGYFVTYSANGGTSAPTDLTSYEYNNLVTVKAQGSMTNGTKSFASWNTLSNGTGTTYNAGSQFYITGDTTLHAQWADQIYAPNAVSSFTSSSGTGSLSWKFGNSIVDSTHSSPTGYAYTYSSSSTTPSNGSGTFIDTTTWASVNNTFSVYPVVSGTAYYGFIQPRNTNNGVTQYGPWSSLLAITLPPPPTFSYYFGIQNLTNGGINIYGDSSSTIFNFRVYRTGNGTGSSGYGTGTYSLWTTKTFTKSAGGTYFGTYYVDFDGYYYIVGEQINAAGSSATTASQSYPQNWFWGPPPKPTSGTVSISTNTGNYSVGSVITYSTSGWTNSPYSTGYVLELHNGTNPVLTSDPLRASTTSSSGTYTIQPSDVSNYFKAWATASNAGGTSDQAFSNQVGPAYTQVIPGSPTINYSSNTTSSITLNFTKGTNSTSTRAYLNGSFNGSTTGTSYTFYGLSAGTNYALDLYGYDGTNISSSGASGTYATASNAVSVPATPTGLTISGSGLMSWSASAGATSYTVTYWLASSSSGANAFNAGTVNVGNVTSYQITYTNNPSTGVYCNYADGIVLASNSAGSSAYSAWYPSSSTYV